jgi:hypothetical protein
MYVHSLKAAGNLGMRATGCLFERDATTLLQLRESKPLLEYKPPALTSSAIPMRPETLRLLSDV